MWLLGRKWPAALLLFLLPGVVIAQPGGVQPVRAGNRLVWDQRAPGTGIAALRFTVYVDGAPIDVDVSCVPSSSIATFSCHAFLPSLRPGIHVISVAAHVRGREQSTGVRSTGIRVRFDDQSTVITGPTSTPVGASHMPWRMSQTAGSFFDITDIAVLDGIGVIVAERSGHLHLLRAGSNERKTFALPDVRAESGGLVSIAAEPIADGAHALYVMYATRTGVRVSRMGIDTNIVASPATVLIEGLPLSAARPSSVMRIGPDGKLYLAIEDGGNTSLIADAAAYEGKVLRVNTDGTTPRDAARPTPVYAVGLPQPTGVAWVGDHDETLWVVGAERGGRPRLEARTGGRVDRSVALSWKPSRAVSYRSKTHPDLAGSVLIGDAHEGGVWRATIESDGSIGQSRPIAGTNVGSIRSITTSPEGVVYVATATFLWRLLAQ